MSSVSQNEIMGTRNSFMFVMTSHVNWMLHHHPCKISTPSHFLNAYTLSFSLFHRKSILLCTLQKLNHVYIFQILFRRNSMLGHFCWKAPKYCGAAIYWINGYNTIFNKHLISIISMVTYNTNFNKHLFFHWINNY